MVVGEPGRRFLWHKIYLFALLEELIGVATSEKDGLMPSIQRMTTSYQKDQQKYCKIAEFRNRLTGISMLISVFKNHENSSPSVVLLTGYSDDLSVNSIKRGIYLTNVYYQKKENKTIVYVKSSAYVYISTLCIGMNGSLKLSHENNLDLPSDAIEIPISWQEFSNIWELEGLLGINDTWYKRRFGEITDFNEANNTGYMFVDKTQSLDNKPNTSSNYGFLETIAINEVTIKQTFVDFQSRFFIRICNNGTWTDWKQIQTT